MGRKPYTPFSYKLCEWRLDNYETSSDEDDDLDVGFIATKKQKETIFNHSTKNYTNIHKSIRNYKIEQKQLFYDQRCEENIM